jgi:predicted alpha/beta hydrolase
MNVTECPSDDARSREFPPAESTKTGPEAAGALLFFLRGAGRGHFGVFLGQGFVWDDAGRRDLHLVVEAAHNAALARQHGRVAILRDIGGIVLLLCPDLGVEHIGAAEELGLGRTRHVTVTRVSFNSSRNA